MAQPIAAIFIDFNYEDLEVTYPKVRLEEAGFKVLVFGSHPAGTKYTGKYGYPTKSDHNMGALVAGESFLSPTPLLNSIRALVLPGGFSPDYMRRDKRMLFSIVNLFQRQIPIGAICHGPWMFCSARGDDGTPIINGLRCTSFVAIKDDVINAGGKWEDSPVVNDKNLISARTPADLVPFCLAIIEAARTKRSLPIFTVDSFSGEAFAGNPAAVCLVSQSMAPFVSNDSVLQKIAAEMNISETAFVQAAGEVPVTSGDQDFPNEFVSQKRFSLRWFTPTLEVDLCGHATLATAAAIMERNASESLTFSTLSGDLVATRKGDSILLDLPLNKPSPQDASEHAALIAAVIGPMTLRACGYSPQTKKLLIELDGLVHSRGDLEKMCPKFSKMQELHNGSKIKGIIVTLRGTTKDYDFVSRYFAPWNGIMEDPVTGSAHTVLAGYWSEILGKTVMTARQCSKRGGDLDLVIKGGDRVSVGGRATIVLRGKIDIGTELDI